MTVRGVCVVIDRWHISQPITFTVRANITRQSMPQLRWLMEMVPDSTLTVVVSPSSSNVVSVEELLYVRHRMPKHAVFYDIPQHLHSHFLSVKDDENRFPLKQLSLEESQAFVADQWKVSDLIHCITVSPHCWSNTSPILHVTNFLYCCWKFYILTSVLEGRHCGRVAVNVWWSEGWIRQKWWWWRRWTNSESCGSVRCLW